MDIISYLIMIVSAWVIFHVWNKEFFGKPIFICMWGLGLLIWTFNFFIFSS